MFLSRCVKAPERFLKGYKYCWFQNNHVGEANKLPVKVFHEFSGYGTMESIRKQFIKNGRSCLAMRERISIKDIVLMSEDEDEDLLFGQFLDDFYHAEDKYSLIEEEPPYREDKKILLCDLAGTAHKLANDYQLSIPDWVFKKRYTSNVIYYAFNTKNPEFQQHLERTTPLEYKQRNLMVGNTSLERC